MRYAGCVFTMLALLSACVSSATGAPQTALDHQASTVRVDTSHDRDTASLERIANALVIQCGDGRNIAETVEFTRQERREAL